MTSSAFLSRVSFVNKISIIMKATSNDDTPVLGYLYKEISALESVENCESTLDFLVDRLNQDSCHVKLKVLKVMRYVVENGHPNFRLGLLKKSRGIQEATKHNGPPDPLHGNVPYVMVRKAAQELSEVLFNIESAGTDSVTQPEQVGLGPQNSRSSSSNADRPRMEGFGNTNIHQSKSLGENIKDGLLKMAESLGETTVDQQRAVLSKLETRSGYKPPSMVSGTLTSAINTQEEQPVVIRRPLKVSPPKHVPGRAGGGWDDEDDDLGPDRSNEYQRSRSSESGSAGLAERLETVGLEDWASEETLVKGYTQNMTQPLLKRAQISAFLRDCADLNCDKIVEFLNNSLSSTDEQTLMRTMLLLEGLMTSDLVNLERLTCVCRESLLAVYQTNQGPPQAKARKIIRILEKLTNQKNIIPLSSSHPPQTDTLIVLDNTVT